MEEIAISAKLNLVGEFAKRTTKGQPLVVVNFTVWLNSPNHDVDTEITNTFTTEQLESLKKDFIDKYEESQEVELPADDESRGCDAFHYTAEEGVSL